MILRSQPWKAIAIFVLAALCLGPTTARSQQPGNDLDQFMAQVLARRDDNWRKLQQYVLDEKETADFLGPGRIRLFALDREYTWYIRDGIFVRSPVRFDGVALSEADRRKAEQEWIDQERSRQKEQADKGAHSATPTARRPEDGGAEMLPAGLDAILDTTREPQFVSAAYFFRFKFEPGHYAYVGPETYEGRKVLRIEYYPSRLYDDEGPGRGADQSKQTEQGKPGDEAKGEQGEGRKNKDSKDKDSREKDGKEKDGNAKDQEFEDRVTRQMNKVAMVTLWIEPTAHQIVQFRFDNLALNFLPGRSIVRVNGFGATMKMAQAFPGVWLPQGIDASGAFTLANGTYDAHYRVKYLNYREATVQVKIR